MPRWLEFAVIALGIVVAVGALWRTTPEGPETAPLGASMPIVGEIEVTTPPTAPVRLPEVPPSVGSVLSTAGNAEFLSTDRLRAELPASVVAVLVEAGATLRVAEESP